MILHTHPRTLSEPHSHVRWREALLTDQHQSLAGRIGRCATTAGRCIPRASSRHGARRNAFSTTDPTTRCEPTSFHGTRPGFFQESQLRGNNSHRETLGLLSQSLVGSVNQSLALKGRRLFGRCSRPCAFSGSRRTRRRTRSRRYRYRATREHLKRFSIVSPESQCRNLALTVLYVPYPLDKGRGHFLGKQVDALTEALLSHIMYSLIGFRKPTPPQNRQLIVYFFGLRCDVDDFVGELTF